MTYLHLLNSRVPDIVAELRQFGIEPLVHDPLVTSFAAQHEYGRELTDWQNFSNLDGMILAVSHRFYLDMPHEQLLAGIKSGGVLIDVKSAFDPAKLPQNLTYWSL
ncbi:MAG TPA: UDP binding domain-containing protein [Candidatus Sericytochromatia bacterium]